MRSPPSTLLTPIRRRCSHTLLSPILSLRLCDNNNNDNDNNNNYYYYYYYKEDEIDKSGAWTVRCTTVSEEVFTRLPIAGGKYYLKPYIVAICICSAFSFVAFTFAAVFGEYKMYINKSLPALLEDCQQIM